VLCVGSAEWLQARDSTGTAGLRRTNRQGYNRECPRHTHDSKPDSTPPTYPVTLQSSSPTAALAMKQQTIITAIKSTIRYDAFDQAGKPTESGSAAETRAVRMSF